MLIMRNKSISGSIIGGLPATQVIYHKFASIKSRLIQACIDFCHKHNIIPKTKLITDKDLDGVYEELRGKNDSVCRFYLNLIYYYEGVIK